MATTINNTASATYGYGRIGTDTAVSNTATTSLIDEYAISGGKLSNNSDFRNGENITYQIFISNDGISSLYNVTAVDNLGGTTNPLTFIDSSATLNINGVTSGIIPTSVNPLTFVLPSPLASGEVATITFLARVSSGLASTVTTITNTVTINANEGSTTGPTISVTPNPEYTLNRADYADVLLTKNVSSTQIISGQEFSYTLNLLNSGNLDATGVVITDTLPAGFVISSITALTDGVTTTFSPSDYTIEPTTNTLTLPTSGLTITVPASVGGVSGSTVVTITGAIS